MKNKLTLLIVISSFFCCNQKKSSAILSENTSINQQESIHLVSFSEYHTSVPANFDLHKFESIEIDNDSIYLKEYTFRKGKFYQSKIQDSKSNGVANKKFLRMISKEKTLKNKTLGLLGDEYDGGGISVSVITKSKDTIAFKMSLNNKTIEYKHRYIKEFYDSINTVINN